MKASEVKMMADTRLENGGRGARGRVTQVQPALVAL